jgi:translation initiation factor IF-3
MLFRGREMAHRDLGMRSMHGICDTLGDIAKVEQEPKMMGRRMTMVLAPDRTAKAMHVPQKIPSDPQPQPVA